MKIVLFANSSWNLYNFRIGLIKELVKSKYKVFFLAKDDIYSQKLLDLNVNHIKFDIDQKGKNIFKEIKTDLG